MLVKMLASMVRYIKANVAINSWAGYLLNFVVTKRTLKYKNNFHKVFLPYSIVVMVLSIHLLVLTCQTCCMCGHVPILRPPYVDIITAT